MNTPAASQIIRCSNCGANNRVDPAKLADNRAVCGQCKTTLAPPAEPVEITDANFKDVVISSTVPVLVDFWATWCGPCRMIAPIIEQLARDFAGRARIGKLDVDANPMTAMEFNVQSIPMLFIFKDGQVVDRIVGLQSRELITGRLDRFL